MKIYAPGPKGSVVAEVETDDPMLARTVMIDFLKANGYESRRVLASVNASKRLDDILTVQGIPADPADQQRTEPAESEPGLEPA